MRKIMLLSLIFTSILSNAQYSISGTFTPAKDYTWLIAYQLQPGSQNYIADTAISNGKFSLQLPSNAASGTYRLVYAVPQEEFYFDVIYNGKENVILTFDSVEGVDFTASQENILFGTYFNEINTSERSLVGFFAEGKTDESAFEQLTQNMIQIQNSYEKKSHDLLVNEFITANRPYIPSGYKSIQDYVQNKKQSYFKNLDLNNPLLQASGFLNDKLINYAFTALPLEQLSKKETEKHIQENVNAIHQKLENASEEFKFHTMHTLWTQADTRGFNAVSDYIYSDYLKTMANNSAQKEIVTSLEVQQRLRIGAKAPEISWKNGDAIKNLSSLNGAKNYVLIFWSSTCSHCLNELPPLHKKLKEMADVKVIAIGLEDNKTTWTPESAKLQHFEHVIALGRWESEYAKSYDIHQTPTYYILDGEKRIIAKLGHDKEVIEFLAK